MYDSEGSTEPEAAVTYIYEDEAIDQPLENNYRYGVATEYIEEGFQKMKGWLHAIL